MKKIKATYIGDDKSLGYEQGKEYSLLLHYNPYLEGIIGIKRVSGGGETDYHNILDFIRNWTLIKTDNAIY